MPTIKYPKNPNIETAFVEQDDGTKNRVVMTAPQDISTLEYPSNPNSTKGYVTVNGKKQRVVMTADIAGGGSGSAVTSVNGKTGDVVLNAKDVSAIPQVASMPTAAVDELGNIYQFVGTTTASYTNGYFYKCVSDGQNPATYSWARIDVQPAPEALPDQTGNAGKFLITDGTNASWANVATVPATTPTLVVADWSSNTQTITVTGVTASNVVLVSPAPSSASDYASAGIICTAQGTDSLTFSCDTVPTNAIDLSVVIL